ncbi:MAG: hypothetical protein IPP97_05925 [Candidatus Obscuribacter sp.]|jgi:hypothetical protein|nr:hypothetical protein [Candidatus Obscuribacter sp.]MBP6349104.1 hypothetical protein [Candidatus Obscuribacter sp.]MBP7576001.1 hypothetical protein [Candidatus Obscuribacter sp.]
MKMTAEAAERQAEESTAATATMNSAIKEVYGDKGGAQFHIFRPQNACIVDKDGFIACGPIVGIERPSDTIKKPGFTLYDELNPEKPKDDLLDRRKCTEPQKENFIDLEEKPRK